MDDAIRKNRNEVRRRKRAEISDEKKKLLREKMQEEYARRMNRKGLFTSHVFHCLI